MRCLYCGKELALLKRWTSGGEFCSDAHRQRYQDEYNKLALNRLLQAKPESQAPTTKSAARDENGGPVEKTSPGPVPVHSASSNDHAANRHADDHRDNQFNQRETPGFAPAHGDPEPKAPRLVEPAPIAAVAASFEPEPVESEGPADPAGFLMELPVPVMADVLALARVDLDLECGGPPELPRGGFEGLEAHLFTAAAVESVPFTHILDCVARQVDRRFEVREFVRAAPVIDVNFGAETNQVPEIVEESMEIPIDPHPPQGSPPLWQELWREFEVHTEWDALTRIAFRTTGLEDNADGNGLKSLSDVAAELASIEGIHHETLSEQVSERHPHQDDPPQDQQTAEAQLANDAERDAAAPAQLESTATPAIESAAPVAVTPAEVEREATAEVPAGIAEVVEEPHPVSTPPAALLSKLSFGRWPSSPKPAASSSEKAIHADSEPKPEAAPAPAESKSTESTPALITKPQPLTLHGLAAGRGKPVQVFASPVWAGADLQIPRSIGLPLRPMMTLGAAPAAEKPGLQKPIAEKPIAERPMAEKAAIEKKAEERRPDRTVVVKVDPRKGPKPDTRFANKSRKNNEAAESKSAGEQVATPAKDEIVKVNATIADKPVADKPAADKPVAKTAEPAPESEKTIGPEKGPRPAKASGEERTGRKTGDKTLPAPIAAPYEPSDLGIPSLNVDSSGGFWKRLPIAGKIGLVLTLVALVAIVSFVLKSSAGSAATGPTVVEAAPISGAESSWITDWGAEPGVRKAHDISVLRPSLTLTDYRLEFEAQIEAKALGWIYRAQDEKNYYVAKLEILKPGLEPTVALVRYAVINGEEGPRAQFPLTIPLRIDTMYKIRFDALGDHFTTYVQDQKVDDWTDGRLKKGGVGLYSERGERINLKGSLRVAPLVIKK